MLRIKSANKNYHQTSWIPDEGHLSGNRGIKIGSGERNSPLPDSRQQSWSCEGVK